MPTESPVPPLLQSRPSQQEPADHQQYTAGGRDWSGTNPRERLIVDTATKQQHAEEERYASRIGPSPAGRRPQTDANQREGVPPLHLGGASDEWSSAGVNRMRANRGSCHGGTTCQSTDYDPQSLNCRVCYRVVCL
jgi:hypothetical protein